MLNIYQVTENGSIEQIGALWNFIPMNEVLTRTTMPSQAHPAKQGCPGTDL